MAEWRPIQYKMCGVVTVVAPTIGFVIAVTALLGESLSLVAQEEYLLV